VPNTIGEIVGFGITYASTTEPHPRFHGVLPPYPTPYDEATRGTTMPEPSLATSSAGIRENNIKTKDFPLFDLNCQFTDDTVAVADVILNGGTYTDRLRSTTVAIPKRVMG